MALGVSNLVTLNMSLSPLLKGRTLPGPYKVLIGSEEM